MKINSAKYNYKIYNNKNFNYYSRIRDIIIRILEDRKSYYYFI